MIRLRLPLLACAALLSCNAALAEEAPAAADRIAPPAPGEQPAGVPATPSTTPVPPAAGSTPQAAPGEDPLSTIQDGPAMRTEKDLTPVSATLADNSTVTFKPDGTVTITLNGMESTPPDGTYTLRDGTTFAIRDGMRVEN